jgi:hypothetical protein
MTPNTPKIGMKVIPPQPQLESWRRCQGKAKGNTIIKCGNKAKWVFAGLVLCQRCVKILKKDLKSRGIGVI